MDLSKVKMTYARHVVTNEIVSIHDSLVSRGLACECICIECGARVVAKKKPGSIRAKHFAHHPDEIGAVECTWSGETELHFKVKEYLQRNKSLTILIGHHEPKQVSVQFVEVILESPMRPSKRIPDVIAITEDGEKIIFEVRVTHGVDENKKREFQRLNISAVEISFNEIHCYLDSDETISDSLIQEHLSTMPFEWLSIAPSGSIAEMYHTHERRQLKKLLEETELQSRNKKFILDSLDKEISSKTNFLNTFKNDCRKKEAHMERLSVSISEKESYIQSLDLAKDDIVQRNCNYIEQRIWELSQSLYRENEVYRSEIKKEELLSIEAELTVLDVKRKELIDELERLAVQKSESMEMLKRTLAEKSTLDENIALFNRERLEFKAEVADNQRLIEWAHKRTRVISDMKKRYESLEQELRPICRKHGIPWPFEHEIVIELEKPFE